MAAINISGATEITAEGIKKHFKSTEPVRALFELIWNGFDAGARTVDVALQTNPLGGLEEVAVLDDGDGVDFKRIENNFGRFNDSDKKGDVAQHGSQGRGRLAFYKLAHEAKWFTKSPEGEATIAVDSHNIKLYNAQILEPDNYHGRIRAGGNGTLVELSKMCSELPVRDELLKLFSNEFGWFLALNPGTRLLLNNEIVGVPRHEIRQECCRVGAVEFEIKIIRWDERPSSEKSYTYLLNSSGRTVFRQLSTLNNKPNFFTSVYVQSAWADEFSESDSLYQARSGSLASDEWRALERRLVALNREVYDEFLRQYVDEQIAKYEEEGIFPTYAGLEKDDAAWRLENTKSIVRTIYTADPTLFNSLKKKQKKILVGLLDRLSVSNENDALLDVLQGVLDLDAATVTILASQLKRTTLEHIVSTIELLQRRQTAVQELRELMSVHYADVLETPDLQKIIENNTWLFGPQYEILGAEEAAFSKIAKDLRDGVKNIHVIEDDDFEGEANIVGAARQPDLFLARKQMTCDSFGKRYFRCVIVEIKRPSISLNIKHLRQLDDYAAIIKRYPEFTGENTHFELLLVGRKISDSDTEIASRMKQQLSRGETGLVTDDGRMKRYVFNWYTLLESFELTNGALLESLKLQRTSLAGESKDSLVTSLQST